MKGTSSDPTGLDIQKQCHSYLLMRKINLIFNNNTVLEGKKSKNAKISDTNAWEFLYKTMTLKKVLVNKFYTYKRIKMKQDRIVCQKVGIHLHLFTTASINTDKWNDHSAETI